MKSLRFNDQTLIVYRMNRYCPQTSFLPERYVEEITSIAGVESVLPVKVFLNNCRTISNLIFSGLLDRFPKQKFVSIESGIGWIPFMLQAIEYQMDESMPGGGAMKMRPTEYFRRQIYASFWFEKTAPKSLIEAIGEGVTDFKPGDHIVGRLGW